MRLIDADALLEILTTAIRNMKGMAKFLGAEDDPEIQIEIKAYTDIANGVNDMPTIESEPHWTPCRERLPEVGTYVLISKKALNFRSNLPSVCTAHRSCDPRSGKEEWNDMLFGKLDDGDVLAWMPLPQPYREESEQDGKTT